MSKKDCRFALMMSSYRRPTECIRQGLVMLNQTYQNFKLFIAVKGVTERTFNEIIKPQFNKHIEDDKVVLRYFPNKNQLSNLLDTIRDCNIDEFDCFCKIDDDDIYAPDYLEQINNYNKEYGVTCSFFSKEGLYMNYNIQANSISSLLPYPYHLYGPTEVIGLNEIKWLQKLENNDVDLTKYIDNCELERFKKNIGRIEDALIGRIISKESQQFKNRAEYVIKHSKYKHCIVTRGKSSITQGKLVNEKFKLFNSSIDNLKNELLYEYTIELSLNDIFCSIFCICQKTLLNIIPFNNTSKRFFSNKNVKSFKPYSELIMQDNHEKIFLFKYDNGVYYLKNDE